MLAAAVLVLSFGHQATRDTEAASTDAKTQMDLVVTGTFGPAAVSCNSATQSKCTLEADSSFTVQIVPSTIPVDGYAGWQTMLDYGSLLYKPALTATDEFTWDYSTISIRTPRDPTGKEGVVLHGDVTALLPDPTTRLFPGSMHKTAIVILNFNCSQNAGGDFSQLLSQIDFDESPSGAAYVEVNGTTVHTPNTMPLEINCASSVTPAPVGGIAVGPDLSALAVAASDSPGSGSNLLLGVAAAAATSVFVLGGSARYAMRRFRS